MIYYQSFQVHALTPECGSGKAARIIYGLVDIDADLKKELDVGKTRLGGSPLHSVDK